eukprot:7934234-Alexandrium_andersonii.AAC.1
MLVFGRAFHQQHSTCDELLPTCQTASSRVAFMRARTHMTRHCRHTAAIRKRSRRISGGEWMEQGGSKRLGRDKVLVCARAGEARGATF